MRLTSRSPSCGNLRKIGRLQNRSPPALSSLRYPTYEQVSSVLDWSSCTWSVVSVCICRAGWASQGHHRRKPPAAYVSQRPV